MAKAITERPGEFQKDHTETLSRTFVSRAGYWWRLMATGLAVFYFMLVSLLLATLVFPIVRLLPSTELTRGRRVRQIIHRSFARFLRMCSAVNLIHPTQVTGMDAVAECKGCIIVANHPTLFDIVILGSMVPDFNCVVKHKLLTNLFLGGCIRAAGYAANDQPQELMRRCLECIDNGQPLIIFPEGTRSPERSLEPFSRGAAHMALRAGIPIVTAVLKCHPPAFTKRQKWWSVPDQPIRYTVQFARLNVNSPQPAPAFSLSRDARALTARMESYFREELGREAAQKVEPYRPAIIIPNHNHKDAISLLLAKLAGYGLPCLIVDDGSEAETQRVLQQQAEERDWVQLLRRPQQGGKGAAVMDGLKFLHRSGYTHAIQMDADGQHDCDDLPKFLRESQAHPAALILGQPRYGKDVPRIRLICRQMSRALVWLETMSFAIGDPLLGYRVYPLEQTIKVIGRHSLGTHMDFDPEIAVRLNWSGVPTRNVFTRVSYPANGFSNFRMFADNAAMVSLHLRLLGERMGRPFSIFRSRKV